RRACSRTRGSIPPRGSTRSRPRSSPKSVRAGPSCAGSWRRRVRVIRGRVFFRGRLEALSLGISEDGKIAAVKKALRGDEEVDHGDALILPGCADLHLHITDPGLTQKQLLPRPARGMKRGDERGGKDCRRQEGSPRGRGSRARRRGQPSRLRGSPRPYEGSGRHAKGGPAERDEVRGDRWRDHDCGDAEYDTAGHVPNRLRAKSRNLPRTECDRLRVVRGAEVGGCGHATA